METFIKNNKKFTVINNTVYIILKGCKPRILYSGVCGTGYYLKKNRKNGKVEEVNIGYY